MVALPQLLFQLDPICLGVGGNFTGNLVYRVVGKHPQLSGLLRWCKLNPKNVTMQFHHRFNKSGFVMVPHQATMVIGVAQFQRGASK